ncbi:helix-turn-helix transcriptional regulator (plasmid) [Rhodococcus opacus]
MVDDAHLLDDISMLVVERLAESGNVLLVLTARTGEGKFETLTDMCSRGLLTQLPLGPLDRTEAYALAEQSLDGEVESSLARQLFEYSEGNPLLLLELLRGSLENDRLILSNGTWHLQGELNASARIREVVESRLRGLGKGEVKLLELLAFVDHLTKDAVEHFSDIDTLTALEERALIKTVLNQRQLSTSLAHPIYGDVLRSNMSGLRVHLATQSLAEYYESRSELTDDTCLQLASLRLVCGGGDFTTMQRAVHIALSRHDSDLALDCANNAVENGGGVPAHILRARVLSKRGEFEKADQAIAGCLVLTPTEEQLAEAAVLRLDFQAFYQGHVDDALQFAATAEERISDERLKQRVAVRRVGTLLHTDGPKAVADAVQPLLDAGATEVESWACMLAAWAYFRLGKCDEAYRTTYRGEAAQAAHSYPTDWYPEVHLLERCYVDAGVGRVEEARSSAQTAMAKAERDGADEAYGGYALFLSSLVQDCGHTDDARTNAEAAQSTYRKLGVPVYLSDAIVHLAIALAMAGHGDEALESLEALADIGMPDYWYFSPELHQARAWANVANGMRQDAKTHFLESAHIGTRTGDLLGALTAWHGCARIGFPRQAVEPIRRLVRQTDSDLARMRLDHTIGLATRDAILLQKVSEDFASAGADLLAAEAAVGAASALQRDGATRIAENWHRRATAMFRQQRGAIPTVWKPRPVRDLTKAEADTAALAAHGRSNADIAKALNLSVRTVENRLQRVYVKLGINNRRALAELSEGLETASKTEWSN